MENKKGWIKIVEAFVAVLLVTGVILILFDKIYVEKSEPEDAIYEAEKNVLDEIKINETLRANVLGVLPPVTSGDSGFPSEIENKIQGLPNYLNCTGKICVIDDLCLVNFSDDKNIYTRETLITTNSTEYNPRKLKIFCYVE